MVVDEDELCASHSRLKRKQQPTKKQKKTNDDLNPPRKAAESFFQIMNYRKKSCLCPKPPTHAHTKKVVD
jgi:hypothetical protein